MAEEHAAIHAAIYVDRPGVSPGMAAFWSLLVAVELPPCSTGLAYVVTPSDPDEFVAHVLSIM